MEGSTLTSFKLSVVAPRSRLKVINSAFAECLLSLLPIHRTIGAVKLPTLEWDQSDLLVIEVPMLEFGKDEVHLAIQRLLITRARAGKHFMLLVLPRLGSGNRGRHEKTEAAGRHSAERPVRRWNDWLYCPAQLSLRCVCTIPECDWTKTCK